MRSHGGGTHAELVDGHNPRIGEVACYLLRAVGKVDGVSGVLVNAMVQFQTCSPEEKTYFAIG